MPGGTPCRLPWRVGAVGCLVVVNDGVLEGFVADVALEAGIGVLVLAEQPAAPLLLRRCLGGVFVEVAAVVDVAGFLQVDAHEVLIGVPDPAGEWRRRG